MRLENVPHIKIYILCAAFFFSGFIPSQEAMAICSQGQEIPGGCGTTSFQGCCADNNTARWCENGSLCQLECDVVAGQLPTHSCCDQGVGGVAGCCDKDIWDCVCAADSYCCTFPWDSVCAAAVISSGCGTCPSNCPGPQYYCGWKSQSGVFGCESTPGLTSPTGDYTCTGGTNCTPNCANKQCGSDGCAGTCGTCPAGQECNSLFQCVASGNGNGENCVPSCVGKACGDDGCGELSCGSCGVGKICSEDFTCIDCIPDCADRECGADGCGDQCGFCGTGEDCSEFGFCIEAGCAPYCPGKQCGEDGCGGQCGSCEEGFSCTSGQCLSESGEKQPEEVADAGGSIAPIDNSNFPGGGTWVNPCQPGQIEQYGSCVTPANSPSAANGRGGGSVDVEGCSATPNSNRAGANIIWLLVASLSLWFLRRRYALKG